MPRPTVYRNRVKPAVAAVTESWPSSFSDLTYDELYHLAQDKDVPGRSNMTKDELIAALED